MIGVAKRYRELLTALLIERELVGGTLPDDVESLRVEALDRCWWAMTRDEQDDVEKELADEKTIDAPADLQTEDTCVEEGQRALPRRAA
jgi:hypothetical protein